MAAPTERDIVEGFRARCGARRDDVELGIGDDGAVLAPPPGHRLVAVVDTIVEEVHFPAGLPARFIAHRALAVNLSDLAAMGAAPAWATLSLTLPAADAGWLEEFRDGFADLASAHGVTLVGGDTTRGPLAISVQMLGFVPAGAWLSRAGARPGDAVFVTGTLGDACAGLAVLREGDPRSPPVGHPLVERFLRPDARVAQGRALPGIASAAIDISDGFAADLGKLLTASDAGAVLELDRLPLSAALRAHAPGQALSMGLSGGDDYELCFTVPAQRTQELARVAAGWSCPCTQVGRVVGDAGLRDGAGRAIETGGYDHFLP